MPSYGTNETVKRYWQQFFREQLADLPQEERAAFEQEFQKRFDSFLDSSTGEGRSGFLDLIGFGGKGVQPFSELPYPHLRPDFDDAVIPSQLHAAAELYYIYQHERMQIFEAARVLRRLFELGRIKIQRGPGARGIYLLEKWEPLRYPRRARMVAYRRAFNYGQAPAPAGAVVNRNFHFQFVAFNSALAQYFRDLTIGEVIRGSQYLETRPFGNIATIQRLGTDLRYALDRSCYGNILALTSEVGHFLSTLLDLFDAPDIKKSFDANTKWDVLEAIANRHLGGARDLSQRAKMAETGRRVLQWIADSDFKTTSDPTVFQAETRAIGASSEAWIAAYRMTPEGRQFPGVTRSLRWALGVPESRQTQRVAALG
jgi:hypothetical protein